MASAASLTDHLLVSWAVPSGPGEGEVCASTPLGLEPVEARALVSVALGLDRLLGRLSRDLLGSASSFPEWRCPEFPLAKEFFAAGPLRDPLFWGRFDVFERAEGGLAVLEYNCDKPAGQREIWAGADIEPGRLNPNHQARGAFRRALVAAWRIHAQRRRLAARPRVGILVDPSHREEFRLAYLYGREIEQLGWPWVVVGPENLAVEDEHALAFGAPIDVVLRQYPAEFLHELPAMADLWRVTLRGSLLWINDPRAVATQAKSLLALAWKLAIEGRLPRADTRFVLAHVPPTGLAADTPWLVRAEARPEDWVIKPVLGRYSQGVALGASCAPEDWRRALAAAAAQPYDYVVQAYVSPRRRWLPAPEGSRAGYVNWGVALAGGHFAGLCPRFQPTPLTEEASTWWAPLRLARSVHRAPTLLLPPGPIVSEMRRHPARGNGRWRGPGATAVGIADRCAMAGYTNVWTNGLLNFTLAAIGLSPADWEELSHATWRLGQVTERVLASLNDPAVIELLGIPRAAACLAAQANVRGPQNFLARFDWARTMASGPAASGRASIPISAGHANSGRWQLLEINSDTPAGLGETGLAAREIARLHARGVLPSPEFWPRLTATWRTAVASGLGADALETPISVGLVGTIAAPEDLDQLRAHARAAGWALPRARLLLGDISELRTDRHGTWLRGCRLDVLFRYYPLDWCTTPELLALLDLVAVGRLVMIPPASSVVPQSKAFLALLHELDRRGFFPPEDAAAVRAWVPPTSLDPQALRGGGWVAKPFLEREGHGVRFSCDLKSADRRRLARADVVFQQRLELASARVPIATADGWHIEKRFMVFGVFLAGGDIAGVYTRAGAPITGREAVFIPLLLDRRSPSRPRRRPRGRQGRRGLRPAPTRGPS